MVWYFVSYFNRFEAYIKQACPQYEDSPTSKFFVVCYFLPMFSYIIIFWLSWYDRTPFHFALSSGIFVCAGAVWLMGTAIPSLGLDGVPCTGDDRSQACEECAVVWFVPVFFLCHYMVTTKTPTQVKVAVARLFLYVAYAVLSVAAQVYLGLYSFRQGVLGSVIGLMVGLVFSLFIYVVVTPHFFNARLQFLFRLCGLYTHAFRNIYDGSLIEKTLDSGDPPSSSSTRDVRE